MGVVTNEVERATQEVAGQATQDIVEQATQDIVEQATQDIVFTGLVDQTKRAEALLSALGLTTEVKVSQRKETKLFDLSGLIPDTISYVTPDLTPTGTGSPIETVLETLFETVQETVFETELETVFETELPWVTQSTDTAAAGIRPWIIGVAAGAGLLVLIAIIVMVVYLSSRKMDDDDDAGGETPAGGIEFVEAIPKGKSDNCGVDSVATVENPLFMNMATAPASAIYIDDGAYGGDDDDMYDDAMIV